jgi:hypothetical protein
MPKSINKQNYKTLSGKRKVKQHRKNQKNKEIVLLKTVLYILLFVLSYIIKHVCHTIYSLCPKSFVKHLFHTIL